jgi:L-idonate 5-dehydrogenase
VVAKEVTLTGAFRFLDEMEEAIALLDAQPGVESVITHEFAPRMPRRRSRPLATRHPAPR